MSSDRSPLQGPVSTSKQWGHHHLHQTKNMLVITMDLVLELIINVHLRTHVDADFTMSIVQFHIDNQDIVIYHKVICYFEFPRIGVAVALRPGDFLLFNPHEPHSISSCCRREDDGVYVIVIGHGIGGNISR